ncbi:MAG TPA: DNA polymerase III subunit gamma/tau [Oceanospirillales bacterium]|nr:DNA polymerase III subunit gamma/tau [Oceanospirillales bacterium]
MTYQALARQYRPQNFTELVGQEHVTQALINGLEQGRIHHAFLFTGTRGVGKTTVARILAKALNCEKGVTGNPCCQCSSCLEIAEGRFVDLVEVDAASKTGVDDTRELLENVQYAPTKGRYKIYLIDEVHMFSKSSFNALLKTLEEPPPHVKFLLATTEPKKLPVTVLSRCLQFNLKRLNLTQIQNHLIQLLELQNIEIDSVAIELIARAADGSMRDGLSLLDQALAYGAGTVTTKDVTLMLGSMDQKSVVGLLNAVIDKDKESLNKQLTQIFNLAPDYSRFLHELALLLHEVSLCQILNSYVDNSAFDKNTIKTLTEKTTPAQVQLFYQIILKGQEEINLAPDSKTGFEMTIIRLFAFEIGNPDSLNTTPNKQKAIQQNSKQTNTQQYTQQLPSEQNVSSVQANRTDSTQQSQSNAQSIAQTTSNQAFKKYRCCEVNSETWQEIFQKLAIQGPTKELARNSHVLSNDNGTLVLAIDEQVQAFMTDSSQQRLSSALKDIISEDVVVQFKQDDDNRSTIAKTQQQQQEAHIAATKNKVEQNTFVQHMQENFDAELIQIKQGESFI